MDLHHIREEYRKRVLSQQNCQDNPISQFELWMNEAINSQVCEPTAMNISTVDKEGRPSSRVVLLKEVNSEGFVFFTNYHSHKGQNIANNPNVAIAFFWPELERQVRIEGKAEKIPTEQSDEYFASRPYTSQIGAWASEQSTVISGYKFLLSKAALIAARYPFHVPRPMPWGGYLIRPEIVEFWQGRPSRLHDRIYYRKVNSNWIRERLSP